MPLRNLTRWKLRSLAIALAAVLPLAPAQAQDAHGAIAFGKSGGGRDAAYGFAWNHAKRDGARAAALNACSAAGGADCALLARFENGCGALAMDRYGRAQGKGALSRERAEARAMRACKSGEGAGCAIVAAVCAEPGKKARAWSGSDSVVAVPATASSPAASPRKPETQAQLDPKERRPPRPRGDELSCVYRETPVIWQFRYPPLGGKVKICMAVTNCFYRGKYYPSIDTACYVENDDCPSATECSRPNAENFQKWKSKKHVVPK